MSPSTNNKATKKPYERLTTEFIVQQLMDFYESKDKFRTFFNERALSSKRRSLFRVAKEVNLLKHKEDGTSYNFVHMKLLSHLQKKKELASSSLKKLHEDNRVLTPDEVKVLVDTATMMANMGLGIDPDTCLEIVNSILKKRIEAGVFVPTTIGVVKRIIANNSNLLRLVRGNSIDTKRVRQADKDVRNAMFVKLDNYIKILYLQGKVPWKSWSEVPPECMSNMDELAVNAHGYRKKIIAPVAHFNSGRTYQETSCGDSKMPFHITVCLTTTAKGK